MWTARTFGMCLCLLLLWPRAVTTDFFSSLSSLKSLVVGADRKMQLIEEYVAQEEHRLQSIRNLMDSLQHAASQYIPAEQREERATRFVEHPVNALNLIKDWLLIRELCNDTIATPFRGEVLLDPKSGRKRDLVPAESDYEGAISALARLQKTYKLPTAELAAGTIYNISADSGLDTTDYYHLAEHLVEKDHALALLWYKLVVEEGIADVEKERTVHQRMIDIYEKANDIHRAHESAVKISKIDISDTGSYDKLAWQMKLEDANPREETEDHIKWKPEWERAQDRYEALCRGENVLNDITVTKDLICVYRKGVLPYVQYKEEIHWFSPRISLILDVITDNQAAYLRGRAAGSLNTAMVGHPTKSEISNVRVGKLSWQFDTLPEVAYLSRKVADITGLSTTYRLQWPDAEAFQVLNYGVGGQYEPHHDYYLNEHYKAADAKRMELEERLSGDRIATFMFYLNDVAEGGATAFPKVGVRVPPIKNAAAFWYNFDLAGQSGDPQTFHAGCPVLLGQKWIANKWIKQRAQAFTRPCGLVEDQWDPIWYK